MKKRFRKKIDTMNFAVRKLYKYFSFNQYSRDNVANNVLWFANPNTFNDPYDSKLNKLTEYLRHIESSHHEVEDYLENVRNNFGISCFSEELYNKHMWSHYSDGHRGFCIEYNLSSVAELFYSIGLKFLLEPVYYSNGAPNMSLWMEFKEFRNSVLAGQQNPKTLDALTKRLILEKDKTTWSAEKEHRFILPSSIINLANSQGILKDGNDTELISKKPNGYELKLPKYVAYNIYFGCKASYEDKVDLIQRLKKADTHIHAKYQMFIGAGGLSSMDSDLY